ncbi:hypothetical protein ACJMK2_009651 [Sinanodonta woodiana]|uniref:Chlorophyllase n=1 Tax=Sinanodonta woodiana TaxID=1069815 RepID=A0ABD3VEH8_SINWO
MKFLTFIASLVCVLGYEVLSIYVDWGNPYDMGRLPVNDLTITETIDKSPLHTTAHYPNQSGEYPVVFFIGGMNGYVLSEMYTDVLRMVAAHGFIVFGVDYKYPALNDGENIFKPILKQDLKPYFNEIDFLKTFMVNKSPAKPVWNKLALMCHSSGCDCTLRMLRMNTTMFTSTVFIEPVSFDAFEKVPNPVPALMYGTELSEKGLTKCCLPGTDFRQFYKIWKCPRLALEVADFGHCDILNREFWGVCTHICTKSNETRIDEYHKFIQGAMSSFVISTLQMRQDAITYLSDTTKIPVKLLEHQTDLNCTLEKKSDQLF